MNTKQFIFLVALYCALHLAACYFQWRDRQTTYNARQTFTLLFDFKNTYAIGVMSSVLTLACYLIWFVAAAVALGAGIRFIWCLLA